MAALLLLMACGSCSEIADLDSNSRNKLGSPEDFELSIGGQFKDAQIEIEDIVIKRDISDGISNIRNMPQKLEVPTDELLKQTFFDVLSEIEHGWKEFQSVLAHPETKKGVLKAMAYPGTKHIVRPSMRVSIAVFKKGNIEYGYKGYEKDGRFVEAMKLVYRDNSKQELDKAKSRKISFDRKHLSNIQSYASLDLSLYVRFDFKTHQISSISKTTKDKKIHLDWRKDGSLISKSVEDVK